MAATDEIDIDLLVIDILEYMSEKGLSQTGFSDKSGISKSTVSRLISKTGIPDMDIITMVCKMLRVPFSRYQKNAPDIIIVEGGDTMANIKALLNEDPKLSDDSRKSLYELMEMAYKQFRGMTHV